MLPALMLERVARTTNLPMDVHIMSLSPECYFPQVLPWCRGGYVSIHAEGLRNLPLLLSEIRNAGVGAGVALNAGTPLCCLEEVAPLVDMVVLMNGVAGCNRMKLDIDSHMENRIRRTRALLDRMGRTHALLSVDGNISLDNARRARRGGANTFVLGTGQHLPAGKAAGGNLPGFSRTAGKRGLEGGIPIVKLQIALDLGQVRTRRWPWPHRYTDWWTLSNWARR